MAEKDEGSQPPLDAPVAPSRPTPSRARKKKGSPPKLDRAKRRARTSAAREAPSPVPSPAAVSAFEGNELPAGVIVAGRFEVQGRLGRGGMGIVYAVRHLVTGEELALKVLHPSLIDTPGAVERFRTEARAPMRIGTDHVVKVIEADVCAEIGDVPYMVMERLSGRDLASELRLRGALPAGEVCVYLGQVAETLDRAHAAGIIHRDLKPANLFLTRTADGAPLVKILDFGIAKLADAASAELTQDGCVFGTPWFMSPEQASGNSRGVGPAADLWALGLLAYRLLTGRNYWTGEGIVALIGQIVHQPMAPPSQSAPHLGPMFDVWFARACNRDIEQRFDSASEQIRQLAKALGIQPSATEASNSAVGATIHIDICMPEAERDGDEPSAPLSVQAPVSQPWSVPPLSATQPPPRLRERSAPLPVFAISVAVALCLGAAGTFVLLNGRSRVEPPAAAAVTQLPLEAHEPAPPAPHETPADDGSAAREIDLDDPAASAMPPESSPARPDVAASAAPPPVPSTLRPRSKKATTPVPHAPKVGHIDF